MIEKLRKRLQRSIYREVSIGGFTIAMTWNPQLKQVITWIGQRSSLEKHSIDGKIDSKKVWKPYFKYKSN